MTIIKLLNLDLLHKNKPIEYNMGICDKNLIGKIKFKFKILILNCIF